MDNTNIENTDPRKVGTSGLEGLKSFLGDSKEDSYENLEYLRDFIKTPSNSKERIALLDKGAYEASGMVETIPALDLYGYGESGDEIDREISEVNDLKNLEDYRATHQTAYEKLGNGLMKMASLAKNTYLETVGLGINSILSEGKEEGFDSVWNQDHARFSYQAMKEMEKEYPNFYSEEEQEVYATGKWYTQLDTANFWGDHFLKNLGFTIGAGLGATASPQGFMIKLMSGIPVAGKYIARTLGTMFASAGEANVEAFHAYQEFKEAEITKNSDKANAYYSSIANKYTKRLEELQSKEDAINKILSNNNVSRNDKNILLQSLDAILKEKMQIEEAWAKDYQNYTATLDSLNADIEKRAIDVGNVTWAANFALLSVTEYFSFGKLFSAGRSVKRGIDIASNRAKSTLGASIAKGVLWEAVQEGLLEEMGQKLISESAKSAYSANDPDSYYDAYIYNKHNVDVNDWQYGLIEGFNNSYGSSAAWEEGFIGAITGGTPMPATNLPFLGSGTDSDDTIGKGKIIGLRGGVTGAIAEYMRNKDKITQQVNTINGFLKRFVDDKGKTKDALAAHLHFLEVMDGLSYTDDEFSYRNARDSSDFALIQAMSEAGLQKHLDKMLNIDFDSMSDEELNSLAKSMNWYTPGTNNKEPITATEAGKKEIIKQLKQNQEAIRTSLNNYRESVEAFSNDPKYRNLSADQITQLAWLDWKIKAFAKRKYDIQEEEKTKIAPLISDIDTAISSLEDTNESKDNVKTLKKLKEVLQGLLDNKEIHSLFKDNKEITDFFSNPLVSTLLSAKEDSIVAANKVLDRLRDSVLLEKLGATYAITLADYIMNPGKLAAKNKEKVQEKQEEKTKEEAKKLEDQIDNMPPSEIMEDDLEQLSLEQLHNSIASSPLVQKIKNKINKAKEAKKDLDTLFNIIDSLQLEEDEALEDRDAYNGMLEHAKNAIDRIFKKALDENRINEFLDINSFLWENFHEEYKEHGNEVLETSRYIISLILEEFRSSKEFQDSVPNKVDNSIPQLNTSGRDNNPEVNPSPDPKNPGNTSDGKVLPFEGKEEEETLEEEIKSSKNYLPVFRRSPDEIYKYWKSSITEFWLSLVNDVLLPTKKVMEDTTPNGYDGIRKKKVIALWDKLKEENAFKNINTLKEGDEIVFRIDYNFIKKHSSIFNNKEDYPIFIYSNNKLIGVLPDKTSRSTNPQQLGLSEVISDIYKKASKVKEEDENIEFFEYEHKSKIADTLQGRIMKSKESKKLNEIFESVENVHIGVCIGGNISVLGNKDNIIVRPLARSKEGKPYVLIPIQDSIFTHAAFPFSMASVFTEENTIGLNKILSTVISNFSGKSSDDIYKILNSLIFEKIRVNTSGNTLTITKEDGKDRINIYNGNSSDTTAIIEAFKSNNLHFNIYASLQSKNTPALFGQFGIKIKDYIDSMKQSVEVKISNLSDSPTDTPVINNWYTIIPINTSGEFLEYERPQHIKTNNPTPNSNPVQQASDKKIATNALGTSTNSNNVYVPPVASTPPVGVASPSTSESLRESIRSLMKDAKIKSKGIDAFIEENTDNISNLEKLYNVLSSTESSSKLRIALNTNDSKDAVNHFLNPENNDSVDPSIDQSNADDDFDDEDLFRVQDSNKYSIIDIQKEMKWFKEVFPNLPEDRIIKHVENLIRIKGNNYAYGMYKRGVITLSELAASGTLYHEAFHFVFDLFVSREEKEKILEEGRKVYLKRGVRLADKYKDIAVEEQLAEAFRRYVQFEETPIIGSLVHIFRQLKHFIQSFLGNEAYIDNLFYRINNAKIDTSEVQPSSSVVRLKEESYTQEMLDIKAKAIADGTFMKAPNGKPSNLNERQWLHVRTKAFKKWFGDWEKIAPRGDKNYDSVGGSPVALSYLLEGGPTTIKSTGYLLHGISAAFELVTNEIEEIRNKYLNQIDDNPSNFKNDTTGALQEIKAIIDSTYGQQGLNILEDILNNATGFYVKEGDKVQSRLDELNSTIKKAQYRNVSKVVDENGEPKEVYHGTNDIFYTFDISNLGSNSGDPGDRGAGFYFGDKDTASSYGSILVPVFLNIRNPYNGSERYSFRLNRGETITVSSLIEDIKEGFDGTKDIKKYEEKIEDYKQQLKDIENDSTKKIIQTRIDNLTTTLEYSKKGFTSRVVEIFNQIQNDELSPTAKKLIDNYNIDKSSSLFDVKQAMINEDIKNIDRNIGNFNTADGYISDYEQVVFSPNQIKSATDNIGTYSKDSDDIRYRTIPYNRRSSKQATVRLNKISGGKFNVNPDTMKGVILTDTQGHSIFNAMGRTFILCNVNGNVIPYYQSSRGTSGKTKGNWYPFFGYTGNWLIKGGIDKNGKMSYSTGIDRISELLNKDFVIPTDFNNGGISPSTGINVKDLGLTMYTVFDRFGKDMSNIGTKDPNALEFFDRDLGELTNANALFVKEVTGIQTQGIKQSHNSYSFIQPFIDSTNEGITESKEEQLSAEDKSSQESLDIMDFGSSKLSYDNLSFDDIAYLSSMNVDREYYESLNDMQKELMLKCR